MHDSKTKPHQQRRPFFFRVQNLVATLQDRVNVTEEQRRDASRVSATLVDPLAAVQPTKDGKRCPGLQGLIVVDQLRFIIGKQVEPTSEQAGVEPALQEAIEIHRERLPTGKLPTMTADTNFCGLPSLKAMERYAEQVLCPPKEPARKRFSLPMVDGKFDKSAFFHDSQTGELTCPAGKLMKRRQHLEHEAGQFAIVYRGVGCNTCPERPRCTSSAQGRIVKWFEVDEKKRQQREELRKPENEAKYRKRKETVELVLGNMKGTFGLVRFRRRGLKAARAEFGLWCLAYNVWRSLSLLKAAQ